MAYDKAKWHFGAKDFPQDLAIEQGGVHIAFFYRWMLEAGFAGEDIQHEAKEELSQILNGELSVLKFFFDFNDGVLLDEDFSEAGIPFANAYYGDENSFQKKYGSYLSDYGVTDLQMMPDFEESVYGVLYSEENYQEIKQIIEERYQQFIQL